MKIRYLLILVLFSTISFSQILKSNGKGFYDLQKCPDLSYENLLMLKLGEYLSYKEAFLYSNDLLKNNFQKDENDKEIVLFFGKDIEKDKKVGNSKSIKQIKFEKKRIQLNGVSFNQLVPENESNFLDYQKIKNTKFSQTAGGIHTVNYNMQNGIIIDKEICNFGVFNNYGKILNRTVTTHNLITINNEPCQMFADATDGTIISFPYNDNPITTKVFCVDNTWNRVEWYDEDVNNPMSKDYEAPDIGFNHPTGIITNGPYIYTNGPYTEYNYPLFVCDNGNSRIVQFTYNAEYTPIIGWNFRILDGSFSVLRYGVTPFDIEVHKGINKGSNLSDENDDVLWFTENSIGSRDLKAINVITGDELNSINSYYYNGTLYQLCPSRISVYGSPGGMENILACINIYQNAIIFFELKNDGTMSSNTPTASSVFQFNSSDILTSVKFLVSNPALSADCYVSFKNQNNDGYLNVFKINFLGSTPYIDYLATCHQGTNSDNGFVQLNNLATQGGYNELLTDEHWDDQYGFRRYKEGLALLGETVDPQYCIQKGINLNYRFSNPSRFSILVTINGLPVSYTLNGMLIIGGYYCLQAGNSWLNLKASLPAGTVQNIKIDLNFSPIDGDNRCNVSRSYTKAIIDCSNPPGGCPYLYVNDSSGLQQDNNILHRSEFPENNNVDITDKYKLNVYPYFSDSGSCTLQINELNNDHEYLDMVQLKAIDHPISTVLGITENGDYILYFPVIVVSPNNAMLNDSNVTCQLQYDTLCGTAGGDSSSTLYTTNDSVSGKAKILASIRSTSKNFLINARNNYINNTLPLHSKDGNKVSIPFNKVGKVDVNTNISHKAIKDDKTNKKSNFIIPLVPSGKEQMNDIVDSIAVIFDPMHPIKEPIPPGKTIAGFITAFQQNIPINAFPIPFARRENRSLCVVPITQSSEIDSVYTEWLRDFNISFFCTTPVYYGGYVENDIPLVKAVNSMYGDVTPSLLYQDQNYAEMDSTNYITLTFQDSLLDPVPNGWVRDYVFITDGRYVALGNNQNKIMHVINNNNNINIPKVFALHQNYPNPFNPTSKIKFDIPKESKVCIKVYDILGREVITLINDLKQSGYYEIIFDGTKYASGVYFYRIEAKDVNSGQSFVAVKKLVLLK